MNKTFMLQSAVQHLELHLTAINSFQLVRPSFIIPLLANKTNKQKKKQQTILNWIGASLAQHYLLSKISLTKTKQDKPYSNLSLSDYWPPTWITNQREEKYINLSQCYYLSLFLFVYTKETSLKCCTKKLNKKTNGKHVVKRKFSVLYEEITKAEITSIL